MAPSWCPIQTLNTIVEEQVWQDLTTVHHVSVCMYLPVTKACKGVQVQAVRNPDGASHTQTFCLAQPSCYCAPGPSPGEMSHSASSEAGELGNLSKLRKVGPRKARAAIAAV
eukprot:7091251-Lingulodinium_polyedra.AAC.1